MYAVRPVYCDKKVAFALIGGAAALGIVYYYYYSKKNMVVDSGVPSRTPPEDVGATKAPPKEIPAVVPSDVNVTLAPGLSRPVNAVPVAPVNQDRVAKTQDPNYQTLAGINNDLFVNKK